MQIKVYTIDFQLPRWLKRGLMFIGIPLVCLLGIGAAVRAAVPEGFPLPIDVSHDYSDGQLLTADSLNTRFNDLKKAANTLATSIDTIQTANSTTQSQVSTIASNLTTGTGVKASSLVCPGCAAATATQPIGSIAFTVGLGSGAPVRLTLAAGTASGNIPSLPCGTGETAIGGACIATGRNGGSTGVNVPITRSYLEGLVWNCAFINNEAVPVDIEIRVHCAKAALVYPQ